MQETVQITLDKRSFEALVSLLNRTDADRFIAKFGFDYGLGDQLYERLLRALTKAIQ